MLRMRQVSQSDFYAVVGPLNVSPRVRGSYHDANYGSDFVTPGGRIVGRTRNVGPTPHYKPDVEYFLCEDDAP